MAGKNKPRGLVENLGTPLEKQGFGQGRGGKKNNNSYALAKTFKNHCKNKVLSTCIEWQEKKQACGRQRLTTKSAGTPPKTIGKTRFWHMATQAEMVDCLGAICATCEILWFSENPLF